MTSTAHPDKAHSEKVCIIGAGSSGLVAAKALKVAGVPFDCFELGSDIGGMWRYENDNGMSSAYRSLHIDTSRKNLGYPDFPIPDDKPDFLSHGELLSHLEAYCDHFELRPLIRFQTEVKHVRPINSGTWEVRLGSGESLRYRAIIVANGHLWDPRWPSFAGTFDGAVIHSHHYRTAEPFDGKDVLVVGIGNSAVDIAVDLCRRAKSVTLSTRRGAWIMPKYLMGIPIDRWSGFLSRRLRLPTRVTRTIMSRLIKLAVGNQERFGVPRPKHPMWREHATLSQELLPYIGHGWISIASDVRELKAREVVFADGKTRPMDAVIYATGYKTTFPFLDPALFAVRDNDARLYRRMVVPDQPGLYFSGLVQPIGPNIPLTEIQGRWLAGVLAGSIKLPDKAAMNVEIDQHQQQLAKTYVGSARYTLEVDFNQYAKQLRSDIAGGM